MPVEILYVIVKHCISTTTIINNYYFHLQTLQNQQYLGDISQAVPMFGEVDFGNGPLPAGVTKPHLHTFTVLYREHCETILEAVYNLQVDNPYVSSCTLYE